MNVEKWSRGQAIREGLKASERTERLERFEPLCHSHNRHRNGNEASSRLATIAWASFRSSAGWEFVTARHFMPARRAPRTPSLESSMTTHSAGGIAARSRLAVFNAARALIKISGSGLPC